MPYRNGTYIAFHANGTDVPVDSDIRYYNLMKAWTAKSDDDFTMINSHDKASSVRDSSKRATLRASLQERLRNSRNMLLIVGQTTRLDTDWVPFEIEHAIDNYDLPIIVAYPGYDVVLNTSSLSNLWPRILADRISIDSARTIHIPFKKDPIQRAIDQFDHNNKPKWSQTVWNREEYVKWGLLS